MVGVSKETTVWRPGQEPLPPPRYRGQGRPPIAVRRPARHRPLSVATLAAALPATAWHTVTWRAGTRGPMRSRFAWLRVRPAHRDESRAAPRPVEWLGIEWPRGESAPTHYWLSTLPETTAPRALVRLAQLRWQVERDYQELKTSWAWTTSKGAAGAASITTPACSSPPTPSWPRSGRAIPASRLAPSSAPLAYPRGSARGALPVRPERHVATSITTMYQALARALLQQGPCPACGHEPRQR